MGAIGIVFAAIVGAALTMLVTNHDKWNELREAVWKPLIALLAISCGTCLGLGFAIGFPERTVQMFGYAVAIAAASIALVLLLELRNWLGGSR